MAGDGGNGDDGRGVTKGDWIELVQDGRALYSALVIGGIVLHATQMMVIAIIMPTIVADIGGAVYYTWASMLYTIGSIVGASSTGPIWAALGARKGYTLATGVLAVATAACALAPDMGSLIVARAVQGWAGGLVAGGGTALVTSLFDARLRTRILSLWQATFTFCHLLGPIVGGSVAAIGWWRGSFWLMVPPMLLFAVLAWLHIPDRLGTEAERGGVGQFPVMRLMTLTAGVMCVAAIAPVQSPLLRLLLVVAALWLVAHTFRLDRAADNKLFPTDALSLSAPIGLSLWIMLLHGTCQTSVTLFLPLLLQVVHGVSPFWVNFLTIVISLGWTAGTFLVSGWSGRRELMALRAGPAIAFASLATIALVALQPGLVLMTIAAFTMGLGIGVYNVHLVARTMEGAAKGEQRTTAAAMATVRSLGTAFGAAFAGVIATSAGLGDARDPVGVGNAVVAVYTLCCIPIAISTLLMGRFVSLSERQSRAGAAQT